jgi:uncharacterized protein (TIGR03437 family)
LWLLLLVTFAAPASAADPQINALLNAASSDQRAEAPPAGPGSLVSIFGSQFAAELPGTATTPVSIDTSLRIPLETSLGGTSGLSRVTVTFDGMAAPLLALIRTPNFDQVNAQIPWGVDVSDGQVQVAVTRDQVTTTRTFAAGDASPGIFTLLSGPGPAIVTNVAFAGGPAVINGSFAHAPGTICGALGNPAGCAASEQAAPVGGVVTIWCNGLGGVDVPVSEAGWARWLRGRSQASEGFHWRR